MEMQLFKKKQVSSIMELTHTGQDGIFLMICRLKNNEFILDSFSKLFSLVIYMIQLASISIFIFAK